MRNLLTAQDIGHVIGTRTLFQDLDFTIDSGQRAGLVGHNGCGKSTLLAILMGKIEPTTGRIIKSHGTRVAMIEQFLPEHLSTLPLKECLVSVVPPEQQAKLSY
ncbi:MAG TPA: ATP-binding cassette domain-containing protein, partial [Alphaproteobacteria bacterium]|nr:ATP-binding cassette domain-containing protein [Alphaproteobacteria bacterium]